MTSPLGKLSADPIGVLLGTNFMRFKSRTGLRGLVRRVTDGIELLAVDAHPPGKGQFRDFIAACKARYDSILILEIWNPWLKAVLERYGFWEWHGTRNDETVEGMMWRRTP